MKFRVKINVMKTIEASKNTYLTIEAQSSGDAEKQVNEMLGALETDSNGLKSELEPLRSRLMELCEDDIESFEEDTDTWNFWEVSSTDILGIEEVE